MTDLKPIDETWMYRALIFIGRYPKDHDGSGPRWVDIAEFMNWRPHSCTTYRRMEKLRRRGVAWDEHVARTTHLTEEGREHLRVARREASRAGLAQKPDGRLP